MRLPARLTVCALFALSQTSCKNWFGQSKTPERTDQTGQGEGEDRDDDDDDDDDRNPPGSRPTSGKKHVVMVIDDGFDLTHEVFRDKIAGKYTIVCEEEES